MPARHIGIDIDRIVLDGVDLRAVDVEAMRTAITAELTAWLSGVDAEDLQAGATPRVAAPQQTVASLTDGDALGRSVARAVRDAVAPAAAPLRTARPALDVGPATSGEPL